MWKYPYVIDAVQWNIYHHHYLTTISVHPGGGGGHLSVIRRGGDPFFKNIHTCLGKKLAFQHPVSKLNFQKTLGKIIGLYGSAPPPPPKASI